MNNDTHTVFELIKKEEKRQQETINLIASENYVSPCVLQATGSVMTNKYAEGYPGKRYYSGCALVDAVEELAIERCKQLFHAEHANVQPHCGSSANMAAYYALLQPGDLIMGMSLSGGGHLTHGHAVNFSGVVYRTVQYSVNRENSLLDYEAIATLAHQHKPKLIVCGASAYSRTIDFRRFSEIAASVGAFLVADIAHIAGLVAAKLHPSPVEHADMVTSTTHKTLRGPRGAFALSKQVHAQALDKAVMPGVQGGPFMHTIAAKAIAFSEALQPEFISYQKQVIANAQAMARTLADLGLAIVTGGTDNHLFIADLRSCGLGGKQAEDLLESVGITVTRSCIPFDTAKPWNPSGIRIGTPAISTRGMQEKEAVLIGHLVHQAISQRDNPAALQDINRSVTSLCAQFPLIK